MTDIKEKQTEIPKNISKNAYELGNEALTKLVTIPDNFTPVVRMDESVASEDEKKIWQVGTSLAWAIRVADSEGRIDVSEPIKKALNENPKMKFYVVYQFLSDSFENEKDLNNEGISLSPVSGELHKFAVDTLKENLQKTSDPHELRMFKNIASRVAEWAKEVGYGSSYLSANEILDMQKILVNRKFEADPYLNGEEGSKILEEIQKSTSRIPRMTLQ